MALCDKLTSGRPIGCKTSGGIEIVYLTEKTNVASYTVNTSNVITGVTMSGSSKFYSFEQIKETSNWKEIGTFSTPSQSQMFTQSLQLKFFKGDTITRNIVKTLGQNSLCAIVKEQSGRYVLLGATMGIDLTSGAFDSGTALGDPNAYTLDFSGNEKDAHFELSSSIIASIISA